MEDGVREYQRGMAFVLIAVWIFAWGMGSAVGQGSVEKILFHSNRDGDFDIYMMDTDGGNVVQITDNTANDYLGSVSPDATQIAFSSDRDGNTEAYTMDIDGTPMWSS